MEGKNPKDYMTKRELRVRRAAKFMENGATPILIAWFVLHYVIDSNIALFWIGAMLFVGIAGVILERLNFACSQLRIANEK